MCEAFVGRETTGEEKKFNQAHLISLVKHREPGTSLARRIHGANLNWLCFYLPSNRERLLSLIKISIHARGRKRRV